MTTAPTTVPAPDEPPTGSGRTRQLLIALVVVLLLAIGIKIVVRRWVRGGGPRRAITGIAEEGAVKLTDAVLDEVLGAA
jgi:hypothetical protein